MTKVKLIVKILESLGDPKNVAGMARYGIAAEKAFGIAAPQLKELAKKIKKETGDRHALALELWRTRIHEARAIAFLIDDPKLVTESQMEEWVADFDNWAICDSTCGTLFSYTEHAYAKAFEWSERDEEFIKRAGIAMIAWLAVHDKQGPDEKLAAFLPVLESKADDDRNFIKKAVNWALRSIGKRNLNLNGLAIECAERIRAQGTKSARWIASDALRELQNETTVARLHAKLAVPNKS
jgi:3-methyladenine DNA glycosylase AlkD